MRREIAAVVKKDLILAKRDPRFMGPSFIVPIVFLSVFVIMSSSVGSGGEAFTCGLVVEDDTAFGEEMAGIIENMRSTTNHTWFTTTRYTPEQASQLFQNGDLIAYILIPEDFGANISAGLGANIVLYVNNVNDDVVKNYVHRVENAVLLYNQGATSPDFDQSEAKVALEETLVLHETPGILEYSGAAAVMLSLMACILTGQAMSTATDFETKAIYDTINSPTSRIALVLGATIAAIPRTLAVLMITIPIITIMTGMTPVGNIFILFGILILTIIGLVPIGELIGLITKKRETALLSGVLLSVVGFFVGGGLAPVALIPINFRVFSLLFPTTYGLGMWTRIFFYDTFTGLLGGTLALLGIWIVGSFIVVQLMKREVERT